LNQTQRLGVLTRLIRTDQICIINILYIVSWMLVYGRVCNHLF